MTKVIKYKTDFYTCKTKCPYGQTNNLGQIMKVGADFCTGHCLHCEDHNSRAQTVVCVYPNKSKKWKQ